MSRPRRVRSAVVVGVLVAVACVPGWRGILRPIPHAHVLEAARLAAPSRVFGVAVPGERDGERWHVQYAGGLAASWLRALGVRGALPSLVAPEHVAHIPAGAERADGYFVVDVALHWPWWRPGGGIDWRPPEAR